MAILSEEDRKLIISLLNEYSEKLLNMCEQIDRQQRNFDFLWLLLLDTLVYSTLDLLILLISQFDFFVFEVLL